MADMATIVGKAQQYWNNLPDIMSTVKSTISNLYLIRNFKYPWVMMIFVFVAIAVWIIIRRNFIKFRTKEDKEAYVKDRRWIRRVTALLRILSLFFIFIALASPFIMKDKVVQGELSITILADNSTSFDLFDKTVAPKLKDELDMSFPATLKYIAEGDKSDISGGILNSLKGDDNILLVTDGQNNYGKALRDMILFAANLNSTISAVEMEPIHDDTSIVIKGPETAIRGTETTFLIKVTQAGEDKPYHVNVRVGQETVLDEDGQGTRSFTFTKRLGEGFHKITGEVTLDDPEGDYFPENNEFYKTIEIFPRPLMYMMADKESYFYSLMMDLYNFKREAPFPSDIESYAAVIIDDISADKIGSSEYEALSNYVLNGSGLVVIGGQSSYNNGAYRNSLLETILPVKTMASEQEGVKDERVNIVILMDVSDSTGGKFSAQSSDSKVDVEKALVVSILDYIKGESKVGLVAFNSEAFEISPLEPLQQKSGFADTIMKLKDVGGTDIGVGIDAAASVLNKVKGSNNIILISDGVTYSPSGALASAEKARRLGINVFTVGVGSDTYEPMMKEIAYVGGGHFYRASQSEKLKIVFGEPEEDSECNDEKKKVRIMDDNHFITQGLDVDAVLTGYNYVAPKSSATPILVTCDGKPIMTIWRYGLGRVVAISTDDGTKWAGQLLSARNSEIITRAINWAIGNPNRKSSFYVEAHDTTLGKPVTIKVKSNSLPVSDIVDFSMVDENQYEGEFNPKETGYYDIFGSDVGVSYDDELQAIGMNPQLYDLVRATGGDVFQPDDLKGIINKTKSVSKRIETSEYYIRWPFLLVAIVILLVEILLRRIWETRK